jgi:predicted alpha/beta superfamily hydrolase/regulation of enolase protein 1 (concanavalin A-like superfamily)
MANPADSLNLIHIGDNCAMATYSLSAGTHRLSGAGSDIWAKRDDFDFASVPSDGDIQITVRLLKLEFQDSLTKAGVMIRNKMVPESKNAYMYYSPKMLGFHHRSYWRNSCRKNEISYSTELPYWLKLIRKGNMFISQRSSDGIIWHTVEIKSMDMQDTLFYGLAICSRDTTHLAKAVFDNVIIEKYKQSLSFEMQNAFIRRHVLYSKHVKDSFEILVGVPSNYDTSHATNYPVAYHLDGGDNDDHYVIRNLITNKQVPTVITVGIGYVTSEDQRERDYLDGFEPFYQFVKNQLIPFIDNHYKTNPSNRTLYGYSYGGLAIMQTLYKYSDDKSTMPFKGLIAGSPALLWRKGAKSFHLNNEQKLWKGSDKLPLNLYMCMGSEDGTWMVLPFKKMVKLLESRDYHNFNLMPVINEGHDQHSNKKICFREGHLWLLNQSLPPDNY